MTAAAEIKLNALMKRDCLSLKRPRETKAWSHARNGFDLDVFPSQGGKRMKERRYNSRLAPTSHFSSRGGAAPTKLALPTALSVFACRGIAILGDDPRRNLRRRFLNENSMRRHNYGVTRSVSSDES